jgi:hypothetical protein
MDKLETIVHLIRAALLKARKLNQFTLPLDEKKRVASLMKKAANTRRKLEALAEASGTNGKLDKPTFERGLDRILKAMDEVNRELDELLAKARG